MVESGEGKNVEETVAVIVSSLKNAAGYYLLLQK